jgi:hypothetical protein
MKHGALSWFSAELQQHSFRPERCLRRRAQTPAGSRNRYNPTSQEKVVGLVNSINNPQAL